MAGAQKPFGWGRANTDQKHLLAVRTDSVRLILGNHRWATDRREDTALRLLNAAPRRSSKLHGEKRKMNTKWSGSFSYSKIETTFNGPSFETTSVKGPELPLGFFSVTGGPKRIIELSSASDLSLASELEQARRHNNIRLYTPAKSKHFALENILKDYVDQKRTLSLQVNLGGKKRKTPLQNVALISNAAVIAEYPSRKSDSRTDEYLLIVFQFTDSSLIYTSGGVQEEW